MPTPDKQTLYVEKDLLDRAIDQVASEDSELSISDINRIMVAAQVQEGIDRYRAQAAGLTFEQLYAEDHNSALLGKHLDETGKSRPPRCHAHAIVAGKHKYAAAVRATMAKLKIRIDDADNGCWLPENTAATPHPNFPRAVPHSRIHRFNYYFWIRSLLINTTKTDVFRARLRLISKQLHESNFPNYVMLPKGAELPKK